MLDHRWSLQDTVGFFYDLPLKWPRAKSSFIWGGQNSWDYLEVEVAQRADFVNQVYNW